jgi:hypothetical protein
MAKLRLSFGILLIYNLDSNLIWSDLLPQRLVGFIICAMALYTVMTHNWFALRVQTSAAIVTFSFLSRDILLAQNYFKINLKLSIFEFNNNMWLKRIFTDSNVLHIKWSFRTCFTDSNTDHIKWLLERILLILVWTQFKRF